MSVFKLELIYAYLSYLYSLEITTVYIYTQTYIYIYTNLYATLNSIYIASYITLNRKLVYFETKPRWWESLGFNVSTSLILTAIIKN